MGEGSGGRGQTGGSGLGWLASVMAAGALGTVLFTTLTATNLNLTEQAEPAVGAAGTVKVYADSTTHSLRMSNNGGAYVTPPTALANPSGTVGLSATNGTAVTAMRSDGIPALSQSIAPTWTGVHTWTADGMPRIAEVAITNAQMLDLADTPVTLIAAPAAGKCIEVLSVSFYFDYVGAYTVTANDDLDVCYTTEANVILTAEATGFVDATADTNLFATRVANYAPTAAVANGAAVVLANNSSDFGGGDAGNEVTVKITYTVWTTGQ